MEAQLRAGWRAGDTLTLPALRTLYSYTARDPGRATEWLLLKDRPPVTTWPPVMEHTGPQLLDDLEAETGTRFTACCFQAYLDGTGCGWHYDADWAVQAILSLGVTRTFQARRRDGTCLREWRLAHGDLLVMPAGFQDEWEHCVPAEPVAGERCSLVFRTAA